MGTPLSASRTIESLVPARMDRLPWSRWHMRILTALGTSWILDGLEVTLVGSLSGVLQSKNGLSLTDQQVTGAATLYLAGAVLGALLFGHPARPARSRESPKPRNMSSKSRFISRCRFMTGCNESDRTASLRARSPRDQGTRSRTFMIVTSYEK
jgi:hypothetical protein